MRTPGFTAEAVLYKARDQYHFVAGINANAINGAGVALQGDYEDCYDNCVWWGNDWRDCNRGCRALYPPYVDPGGINGLIIR